MLHADRPIDWKALQSALSWTGGGVEEEAGEGGAAAGGSRNVARIYESPIKDVDFGRELAEELRERSQGGVG